VDTDLPVGIQLRQGQFHSDCPPKSSGRINFSFQKGLLQKQILQQALLAF